MRRPDPREADPIEGAVRGEGPDDAVLTGTVAMGLDGAEPLSHNSYKLDLAGALIQRALALAAGRS